jgi:hypothetical protein
VRRVSAQGAYFFRTLLRPAKDGPGITPQSIKILLVQLSLPVSIITEWKHPKPLQTITTSSSTILHNFSPSNTVCTVMSDKVDSLTDEICKLGLSNLVVAGLITVVETQRSRDTIDELAESNEETAADDTKDISAEISTKPESELLIYTVMQGLGLHPRV